MALFYASQNGAQSTKEAPALPDYGCPTLRLRICCDIGLCIDSAHNIIHVEALAAAVRGIMMMIYLKLSCAYGAPTINC